MNMAMNNHQLEKYLKQRGFSKKRRGKHGWIWNDGVSNVQIPGSPGDFRSIRNSLQEVERAYKLRLLTEGDKPKPKKEEPKVKKIVEHVPATKPPGLITVQAVKTETQHMNGEEAPAKKGYKKLDSVTRFKVMTLVKQLYEQGKSKTDMAIIIEAAGFRDTGGNPIPLRFISSYLRVMMEDGTIQQTVHAPASQTPAPAPEPAPVPALMVQDPSISPDPAPGTPLVSRTGPSARKLPHWAVSILTDPDLTNNEKVQMLTAMSETR